jgi:hypothetical protein
MAETLRCPKCNFEMEVSTILAAQLRETVRLEFQTEAAQIAQALSEREQALQLDEQALHHSKQSLEDEVRKRLDHERTQLLEKANKSAKEMVALEVQDLTQQLHEASAKLHEAQLAELQLRKDRRDLEARTQELDLTVNRRLDEERNHIREAAKKEAHEECNLRDADRDKLISDLRCQIDVLKRKSELGSQQAQGEVLELELEDFLRRQFPFDQIEPIPRGTHGGDVLHHVYDHTGTKCGLILWEAKRTKAWSEAWLAKLRDDQRAVKAHAAAILTVEMPKDFATFGILEGIWVTNRSCLAGLAAALRAGIVEIARARRTLEGQQTKTELLTNYLSSPEFARRIEGLVDALAMMRNDLESEKRSVRRLWTKREKQLERAIHNTAGFYGELDGILGAKLPQIELLDLAQATEEYPDDALAKAPWE